MRYSDEDVFVYQLMDLLVCEYDYKIVNVPGNRRDVWLANEKNEIFPMIRITPTVASSTVFEKDYLTKVLKALSVLINSEKPLLILNTNKDSAAFVEEDFIQVVTLDRFVSDENVASAFPRMIEKVHSVQDNQGECARLMRHLENNQKKKAQEAKKFNWKNAPKVSIAFIIVSVIAYIFAQMIAKGADVSAWIADVVIAGGYYKALVVYGHEYWRLLTTSFIHYDIFSLLFYGLTLYRMGRMFENEYGKEKFFLTFIVSALVGNACVFVFAENNVSIGLGGAIYGIFAALLVNLWETNSFKSPFKRMQVSQLFGMILCALLFSGADLLSFIGGFVSGLFMAVILSKSAKFKDVKHHFMICSLLSIVCLVYGCISIKTAFPEYNTLNQQIVEEYTRLGLDEQAKKVDNYFINAYEE